VQRPASHASPVVHAVASLQGVPSAFGGPTHWSCDSSHVPTRHWSPAALQSRGAPTHAPAAQVSPTVQNLPSSHGSELFTWPQPCTGSQTSVVHGLPSPQARGVRPRHVPPAHPSTVVQTSWSLHGRLLGVWVQPDPGLQPSVVHTLPSSQGRGVPATQTPPLHVSPTVHALPSSHALLAFVFTQPSVGLQLSIVHGLPSSQLTAGPPAHVPPLQRSPDVHWSSSLHDTVFGVCVQPVADAHESVVHTWPSSQSGAGPPAHPPARHSSAVVQAFPSSHGAALFVCTQPVAGSQPSSVHGLASPHATGSARHACPTQRSFVVHRSESAQSAFALQQPAIGA
jgi:hypothetical protein